ncbi:MAG: helix-turn-helix domain-containing protein [Candidatus Woesearchaeota archaeon]
MVEKQVASLILNAVHHAKTGKERLVDFLRGSHSQLVKKNEMDRKTGYGALFWHDKNTISGFIEQLLEIGLIERFNVNTGYYSYPILILTDAGKKALEDKIEIPLLIRKIVKPITIGDTERETFSLFTKGCKPDEIARRRDLAVSTIFGHIHKLIAMGKINAKQCISEEVIKKVLQAKQQVKDKSSLKEFKLILPEEITYEEIRAVLADKILCKKKQS